MPRRLRSWVKRTPWRALGLVWVAMLTGNWTADGLKGEALFSDWWPALKDYRLLISAAAALVFAATTVLLYHARRAFAFVQTLSQRKATPHRCLVLLVSTPNAVPADTRFPMRIEQDKRIVILEGRSLEEDIEALSAIRWNWQQMLRALVPHRTMLNRIYLIGSKDAGGKGSFSHLPLCWNILHQYAGQAEVYQEPPVDFQQFDQVVRAVNTIVEREIECGTRETDILVDVTGGTKTASIAAASVTLSSQVKFQYVETEAPYQVIVYDTIYRSPVSDGG